MAAILSIPNGLPLQSKSPRTSELNVSSNHHIHYDTKSSNNKYFPRISKSPCNVSAPYSESIHLQARFIVKNRARRARFVNERKAMIPSRIGARSRYLKR
ncbi:hypothetical protein WN55_03179 [Dufourea novaeangliae]|uniref:Uncharacterized protein n=1 Tax=Dufourea novaeangliae TaxID=178035 RepID=A0A154PLE1_DUFNO|nr:hypothetical protein WN55_03179 [Dufourea novaeangliae]